MLHGIIIKRFELDGCVNVTWYHKKEAASWIIICVNVTWCSKKVRVGIVVCVNVTWYHKKETASWINYLCKCYMML
jgi:hypothetical protein